VRIARYLRRPDVRRDPVRLIGRRALFEVERRVAPRRLVRDRIIAFDETLRMCVSPADAIERSIYLFGYHEFAAVSAFCGLVRAGMVVVDAGAHAGQFTLLAAKRAGPNGRVYAVEPHPGVFLRLQRNVRLNAFPNVRALALALSDETGTTTLHVPAWSGDNTGVASLRDPGVASATLEVKTDRLDAVLEGESHLDVVKADVEGAEARLFAGGSASIAHWKPAILFEANDVYERGALAGPSVGALREFGYMLYGIETKPSGVWRLTKIEASDDPRRFREQWQALNLVGLHPDRATDFAQSGR
jgi:FkbM family methyltransferase